MSPLSPSPMMLSVLLKLSFVLGLFDDALPCVYQWPRDRVHDFRSPLPCSRTYYILDGQHKFRAAEILREERECAGVPRADMPDWMCRFRCRVVLQATPMAIHNKVAGREQARGGFSEPVSLHATASMLLKDAKVMRSEAKKAVVAPGLSKKALISNIYIKVGKTISSDGSVVCCSSTPPSSPPALA